MSRFSHYAIIIYTYFFYDLLKCQMFFLGAVSTLFMCRQGNTWLIVSDY